MKRLNTVKLFKKLHKWPGVIIAFIAILFAGSGIVMNHRGLFSNVDLSRNLLPPNYRYSNWNLAAVQGSLPLNDDSLLIFGNIGIWKSSRELDDFIDFNRGFPQGIDNRKIRAMVDYKDKLYAGTYFGLFLFDTSANRWEKIEIPVREERISDIIIKNDSLLVLTRDHLLISSDGFSFNAVVLPQPLGYQRKVGLFITLWQLHSGELWGVTGKLIVDTLGIVTIVLSVTGLLHFFFPKIIRRQRRRQKPVKKLASTFKNNLQWHNVVGYIFALFLVINTVAGIHLRPPLLIPIASKKVGIIPGTHLDTPNPWFDKLRRIKWDKDLNRFIFSTSEGFFLGEETLTQELLPVDSQPPVSVMGLNLFEYTGDNKYLIGSFNGLYLWDVKTGISTDFFTGIPHIANDGIGRPVATNMVTGMIVAGEEAWWFDYMRGALPLTDKSFPEMPKTVIDNSPVSLWSTALEIHTGRIFEHLIGPFYILYVPLAGICLIMVLISGFVIWWKVHRKKRE